MIFLGIPGNGHFRVHHHGPVVDNVRKDAVGNRFLVGGNLHNLPVVPTTHALSRLQLANRDVVLIPVRAVRAAGDQGPTGRQGRIDGGNDRHLLELHEVVFVVGGVAVGADGRNAVDPEGEFGGIRQGGDGGYKSQGEN